MKGADFIDNELGFVMGGVSREPDNELTIPDITPELLVFTVKVVGDHRVSSRKNCLRGTVVLFQHHHMSTFKVTLKFSDVAHICTPECINGLIGVTDDSQRSTRHAISCLPGELMNKRILRVVRVLVLINKNVAELLPVVICHMRKSAEKIHRLGNQVIKVKGISCLECSGVTAEYLKKLYFSRVIEIGVSGIAVHVR